MNIRVLFFLLLHVLAASLDVEPPKQANCTGYITQLQDNIYSSRQAKFDNSRQYSSRQAKENLKLWQVKAKLKLRRHDIAAGSSRRVEEGVDEVVSLPAALLCS
jgi:hypothetical protein